MEKDLREKFYKELKEKLKDMTAIIKPAPSKSGNALKLSGIALYKILLVSNPFGDTGVAIYKNISDEALEEIKGKRAKGKNKWVGVSLTKKNYKKLMNILVRIAKSANRKRDFQMEKAKQNLK